MSEANRRQEGTRFGAYIVVQRLGMGATASVYEARHSVLGRPAAIKVLHEHLAQAPTMAARFVREGRVASTLRHPNVVDIFDVGVEDGLPYLVMELFDGCDFAAWLEAHGKLSLPDALELIVPVIAALGVAHDAGVIHRDLKPSNVFLARDGRGATVPKLVDFGLSRWLDNDAGSALTAADAIVGTLGYMSPEQTEGSQCTTAKSDQYALGAMLYEAIVGRLPLLGRGTSGLIDAIRTGTIKPPSTVVPTLPPAIDAVLLRALARRADDRYPDVRAFGAALLPFANDETRRQFEISRTPSAPRARTLKVQAAMLEARDAETVILPSDTPPPPAESSPPVAETKPLSPPPSLEPRPRPASAPPPSLDTKPFTSPSRPKLARAASTDVEIPPMPRKPGSTTFTIKGNAYRGLFRFIDGGVMGGLDAVCARIGDPRLSEFLKRPFLAASSYDILPMMPLNSAAAALLEMPLADFATARAEEQARFDASQVYRRLVETSTLDDMWRRLPRLGTQYYGFGTCEPISGGATSASFLRRGLPRYIFDWYSVMQGAYCAEIVRLAGGCNVTFTVEEPSEETRMEGLDVVKFVTSMSWT